MLDVGNHKLYKTKYMTTYKLNEIKRNKENQYRLTRLNNS